MLGNCKNLLECEEVLIQAVSETHLLGEISLSEKDFVILTKLINQQLSFGFSHGTRYLEVNARACLVCFLVGIGRYYDKEAGYWPVVENKIGPVDINWQGRWGKIFLDFLHEQDLTRFDEEEGFTYVTPILGHVCIPDSCLPEFFELVLVPLVKRVLLNPLDRNEIIHDLRVRRKVNQKRIALESNRKAINGEIKSAREDRKRRKSRFRIIQEILSLLEDEEKLSRERTELGDMVDPLETREELVRKTQILSEKKDDLDCVKENLQNEVNEHNKQTQNLLSSEAQIHQLINSLHMKDDQLIKTEKNQTSIVSNITDHWSNI